MKLDEIGKTIKDEGLIDALNNFKYSMKQTYLVVDENGNAVNDLASMIDENQYLHIKGNHIELIQPHGFRLERLKQETRLQLQFLKHQLAKYGFRLWPLATDENSGVTVSIQLPEQLFLELYQRKFKQYKIDYYDFRNQIYLKIAQGFELSQPFLTYLTGSSLAFFNNLDERARRSALTFDLLKGIQDFQPDFRSVKSYLGTKNAVGKVALEGQFDHQQGITAVMLRKLDFNPDSQLGIGPNILNLIDVMTGYFLMNDGVANDQLMDQIKAARELDLKVAAASPFRKLNELVKFKALIDNLNHFATDFNYGENWNGTVENIKAKLEDGMQTLAARLLREQGSQSLPQFLLAKIKNELIKEQSLKLSVNSTHVLQAAFEQGMDYQVIDNDQDIVEINGHYVWNGLQSDLDQAITARIWDNKELTKQLVGNLAIQIQPSWKIVTVDQAVRLYPTIKEKAVVLKNAVGHSHAYGILYRMAPSKKEFVESVGVMLKQTSQILVEQVSTGSTYQALILNGKVASLIERVPENVVGDGRKTLKQLIESKQLELGRNEKKTLMRQGLTLDQVVPRGIQVLLRYDSFTGSQFQSVDALNDADQTYIQLLEKIAAQLQMRDGLIDMIFSNIYQPYSEDHPELAVFLSAHANGDFQPHEEMALNQQRDIASLIVEQFK